MCFYFNGTEHLALRRTDRQDLMTLIGGYLNLELTRVDGVRTHLSIDILFFSFFFFYRGGSLLIIVLRYRSMARISPPKLIHLTRETLH